VVEKRISLTEMYTADEVFTTGTMGELTPVREIDGRIIGADNMMMMMIASLCHYRCAHPRNVM